MHLSELSRLLYDLTAPPDLYRLDGSHLELAHVIAHRDDSWVVFLSERGGESGAVAFDDERVACTYLLGRITASLVSRGQLNVVSA
jgi:hypothetical protein